jgi:Ca2+-binding RTX toxin-like protein
MPVETGTDLDDYLDDSFNFPVSTFDDTILGLGGNDTLVASDGNDRLEGGDGNDLALGGVGDDRLFGGSGNDLLDGEDGNDRMEGGPGDDVYWVLDTFDSVYEAANEGIDTIYWYKSFATIPFDFENVVLLHPQAAIKGNDLANKITGNDGPNNFDVFGGGADTLIGMGGNDVYVIDETDTVVEAPGGGIDKVFATDFAVYVLPDNIENATASLSGAPTPRTFVGNAASNVIDTAGAGTNDTLDGMAGSDKLIGGAGNDLYIVDNAFDLVTEALNEGVDTVRTSVSYTIAGNIEILELVGTAILGRGSAGDNTLIGNGLANKLDGLGGHDTLDGKAGADIMTGGAGNDAYILDQIGDSVSELENEGYDTIIAPFSVVLGANFEALTLTGTANLNGTGTDFDNLLIGNAGANVLNGLSGIDRMEGGLGNDVYFVDHLFENTVELVNQGVDTVNASVNYGLRDNVENLNLTGVLSIGGEGNALANRIVGNAGENRLDGAGGADVLAGAAGDDTYIVDNALDVVSELLNAGIDTVESTVSWTLGANLERLFLTGTAAVNATGNTLANFILGNDAANRIDGKTGADIMIGGGGHDVYVVDNAADIIDEALNDGTDTVEATVSQTLGLNVERLTLMGVSNLTGTGNALNNTLTGNTGANLLDGHEGNDAILGGDGADRITGGLGADALTGGAGNDRFQFPDTAQGTDTIADFAPGLDDLVIDASGFGGGLAAGALAANRLVIGPIGGTPAANQPFGQFLYDSDDGRLFWDANGNAPGVALVYLARLTGAPVISALDFVVVA